MKRRSGFLWTIALLAILAVGCLKNDDVDENGVNQVDANFARMASMSNFAEIGAGQLAATRAQDSAVAAYGRMMITDHTAARQLLDSIGSRLNLQTPDSLDAQHVALMDTLGDLQGRQFDSVYILSQVMDHVNAIALFQNEVNSGQNRNIRQYAAMMLPHLQMHLQRADSLATNYE